MKTIRIALPMAKASQIAYLVSGLLRRCAPRSDGIRNLGVIASEAKQSRKMASQEIEALANALARLPGLGPRSARRAVLHLM